MPQPSSRHGVSGVCVDGSGSYMYCVLLGAVETILCHRGCAERTCCAPLLYVVLKDIGISLSCLSVFVLDRPSTYIHVNRSISWNAHTIVDVHCFRRYFAVVRSSHERCVFEVRCFSPCILVHISVSS